MSICVRAASIVVAVACLSGCQRSHSTKQLGGIAAASLHIGPYSGDILSMPTWKSNVVRAGYYDSLGDGFLQPVAVDRILAAAEVLGSHDFVSIDDSQAKRLVGARFLDHDVVIELLIEKKRNRLEFWQERRGESQNEINFHLKVMEELMAEIAWLESVADKLKPYLCRAVAFVNCDTGRFFVGTSGRLIHIQYAALGSTGFVPYNQPVVVFLPFEPDLVSFGDAVAK